MAHRFSFRLRCAALGLPGVLAATLPACSGSGDALGPDPAPPHQNPPPPPPPPPAPAPEPPQQPLVAGSYALATINGSTPGQLVTIANPDGLIIGLYRFDAGTSLDVDPLQAWSLDLQFTDDKQNFAISDGGDMTWTAAAGGIALHFRSEVFGDAFEGLAANGHLTFEYDFDGDGRSDTVFGFARTGD